MAKSFTPIIGLAVVMALALAAVFGSMSLANPAQAQNTGPAIDGLMVTNVTPTTVSLSWDSLEDHTDAHYRAQWTKVSGGVTRASDEVTSSGSAPFAVTVGDDTTTAVITSSDDTSGLPFAAGDAFTILVQSRVDNVSGPYASVTATPTQAPGTAALTAAAAVSGSPGSIKITWAYTASGSTPDVEGDDVTGWQYRTAEYTDENDPVTPAFTDDTIVPDSQSDWMALSASGDGSTGDPFTATVSGLDAKIYRFQVRAMHGQAFNTTVTDLTGAAAATDTAMSEASPLPRLMLGMVTATPGSGEVTLSWTRVAGASGYTYIVKEGTDVVRAETTVMQSPLTTISTTVPNLMNGTEYTFEVTAVTADEEMNRDSESMSVMSTPTAATIPVVEGLPSFMASSQDPADSANYTIKFQMTGSVNTRLADLVIEFSEDQGMPSTIRNTSVTVTTRLGTNPEVTFTPEDVTVDGEKVLLSLGDMDERDDEHDYELVAREVVTVYFRQSAGITNPTEDGGYNLVEIAFGDGYSDSYDEVTSKPAGLEEVVNRKIGLSSDDGGLGDVLTATGKGYKNGTTLTVFVDKLLNYDHDGDPNTPMTRNNRLDLGEDVLCVANVGGDDVGKCEFTVTHPTFSGGDNYVNAVDGRNNYAEKAKKFTLEASIAASPAGGSPGEVILIQVVDFPPNLPITDVEIARQTLGCGGCGGSVDATGADNFSITIPNTVKAGAQELRVTAYDANGEKITASTILNLVGPQIRVNPGSVVANRRVSLVGTGFSPGAVIANAVDDMKVTDPLVSIGGEPIPGSRINDSDPVNVDNGGNWSASVDLPLRAATTAEGQRAIRVTDSRGRTGVVLVTVPARTVTVTPESGRVGTIAVVRGEGFPGKNDEGSSFNIEIVYDANNDNITTVSSLTDASGRFEAQLRIPTTAAIPSSNTIKVSFLDDEDVRVTTTVTHEVPEGVISLSETSGGPGSTVTVSGEGFKSFVPISMVRIGNLEITPAPKPSTDVNGMMEFDVLIPGLDVGIQTIEVSVGQTTASVGFTVIESGINPGDIKPVAVATEELGDNLVSVWNFNNDTKVWAFYDPTLAEGNTLTHMITGETYLIRIKSDQEVILNRDTRNLTCVGGNCWNQVVW